VHSVALVQDTPCSEFWVEALGLGTIDHDDPFHVSTSVSSLPPASM
jgi:hypothetical protein